MRGRRRSSSASSLESIDEIIGGAISDFYGTGILDDVKAFFSARNDYNNKSKKTLKRYGDDTIQSIQLGRQPVQKALTTAFDIISLGKFSKLKREAGYDDFFHLGMVCVLNHNGTPVPVVVEKNEVINISTDVPAFSERVDVPLSKPLTLNELLSKTKEYMDKDFFPYSWADNNCQVFINSILQANGLWSPELHKWLFQPLGELVAKLPEASRWTAKALTDVAAWFNKITGKGYDVETLKEMRKKIDADREKLRQEGEKKRPLIDKYLGILDEQNKAYRNYIIENPGEEEVLCKITEDLKPGRSRTTRGECERRHKAVYDRNHSTTFDKIGKVGIQSVLKLGDAISSFAPSGLATAWDGITLNETMKEYRK